MAKVFKAIVKTIVAFVVLVAVVVITALTFGLTAAAALIPIANKLFIAIALGNFASIFRKTPSVDSNTLERLNKRLNPNATRKIVFGTTAGANDIVYQEVFGSKKDKIVEIVALASHRIAGFDKLYIEEKLAVSGLSAPTAEGGGLACTSEFAPKMNGYFLNGGHTSVLSPIGSGTYWNSNCALYGIAYYVFNSVIDQKQWPEGIPTRFTPIIHGCPVYDPRNPVCDINNQNTWIFFTVDPTNVPGRNPALQLLTYLIGWRQNGKLQWGLGVPAHRIKMSNFIAYANLCDEFILDKQGNSIRRYVAGAIFDTASQRSAVFDALTAGMGSAKLVDVGGEYQLMGGYDDTLGPVIALNDDDLIGPCDFDPAAPLNAQYNVVRGQYVDPTDLYQLKDYPELRAAPLADGIDRTITVDFAAVNRSDYAQRLAKQWLIRGKFSGRFKGVFGPRAFAVQVGSLVTLSFARRGWNGKLFRVMEQTETHDLAFEMTLQEESPLIYQFDRNEAIALPAVLRPPQYNPNDTEQVQGLQLNGRTLPGADGAFLAFVDISWTPELSGRVQGIQIDVRELGGPNWQPITDGLSSAASGLAAVTNPAPGRAIEVRARYRMSSGNYGPYSYASNTTLAIPRPVYSWVAYADSADGSLNFTTGAPLGRRYVGVAMNQTTPTESTNYLDYQWQPGTVAKRVSVQSNTPATSQAVQDSAVAGWAASSIPIAESWADLQSVTLVSASGALVTLDFTLDFVARLTGGNFNEDGTSRVVRIVRKIGALTSTLGVGSFYYQDGAGTTTYTIPGAAWLPAYRKNSLRVNSERFTYAAIDSPPVGATVTYTLQIARYWPGFNNQALLSALEVVAQEINAT